MSRICVQADDRSERLGYAVPLRLTPGKLQFFLLLFAACLVLFLCVTAVYWVNGRSLVWDTDGRLLYFLFLVEEGEWLRGIIASAFSGSLEIPVYSFDYGFGADWLVSASGNSNEAINLLAVFFPPEFTEYLYEGLIFIRFFLAAAAFSLYAFSRGKGKPESFCGALCYVTCGYVLFWGVFRHPNFVDFAILLPLVFMGADKLFAGKNPLLLVLSMAGLFVYSIYFSYMTCIFLLFYCLIQYFLGYRERSPKDFFILVGKFALCLVASFLIVGFSSIPMFISLTSMGRVGVERDIPLFHTPDYYLGFADELLGNHIGPDAVVLGAVPVLGIVALLAAGSAVRRNERIGWSLGIALCVAGAFVSKVGSVMNGFGYSTDRWLLILGFCAAFAVTLVIPALSSFRRRQWIGFAVLAALVTVWACAEVVYERTLLALLVAAMFVALCVVLALVVWVARRREAASMNEEAGRGSASTRVLSIFLAVAVVANVSIQANLFASSRGSSYAQQFIPAGEVYEARERLDLSSVIEGVGDVYRIDRSDITLGRNGSFFQGYKGLDQYTSFYNQAVDDFRQELGLADDVKSTMMNGVQGRSALEMLLGARYFIASKSTLDLVPPIYTKVSELGKAYNGGRYFLYECDNVLPMAFVYDAAVSQNDFDKLNLVERQELMTKAVALAEEDVSGSVPELATLSVPVTVQSCEGAEVEDGYIVAAQKDAKVVLEVEGAANCENYLCFEDLTFESVSEERAEAIIAEDTASVAESEPFEEATSVWLDVSAASGSHVFEVVTSASAKYAGKEDWAINLGYSEKPITSIEISFGKPGIYRYGELYAACQPLQEIVDNVGQLREGNSASLSLGVNEMNVRVEAAGNAGDADGDARFVFISVPYSSGWSATVDGEPAQIVKANVGFMAVEVDHHAHDVRFFYVTPGFVPGAVCSVLTVLALAIYQVVRARRGRKSADCR